MRGYTSDELLAERIVWAIFDADSWTDKATVESIVRGQFEPRITRIHNYLEWAVGNKCSNTIENLKELLKPLEDKAMLNFEKFSKICPLDRNISMPAALISETVIAPELVRFMNDSVKHFSSVFSNDRIKIIIKAILDGCASKTRPDFAQILSRIEAQQEPKVPINLKFQMNNDEPNQSESFQSFAEFFKYGFFT